MQTYTYYIGLMSGTSLDGVDGVLVKFQDINTENAPAQPDVPQIIAHAFMPMPQHLQYTFLALNQSGVDEIHLASTAANQLVRELYTPIVLKLLHDAQLKPALIKAIGAHGQTVRHKPSLDGEIGYSCQLNAPALLAEQTNITVVSDFRSRDIAAGGQGAPLVPAFHALLFSQPQKTIAVLNLGGIANLTILMPESTSTPKNTLGFDTGPANALMDEWCLLHTQQDYDQNGQWAASGKVCDTLLQSMLQEPYFHQSAPKSTGRDLFNMTWLEHHIHACLGVKHETPPQNIQATLLELTARTVASSLQLFTPDELIICGGGAYNQQLLTRLQQLCPLASIRISSHYGIPPTQVEASAFAWLAKQCIEGKCGNLPAVTGAKGARILGAIYQA